MKILSLIAAVLTAALLLVPAAGAEDAPAYAEPVVVGEDIAGDWGDPDTAPIGAKLGMDLVGATIGMPTADTVNFTIKVAELPATGGTPEVPRYIWDVYVDGKFIELDGKWTNYSRGACDPTSGKCPPPRDPGTQPFMVRGNCVTEGSLTTCQELGLVKATFDAAAGTITIPVPAALIGADACSVITGAENLFGENISASPSAFVSSTGFPKDTLWTEFDFTVPSADPAVPCGAEPTESPTTAP